MKHLTLQFERGVETVTLNRPEVRNAFNDEVIAELTAVFAEIAKRPEVRCVVLAGNGPAFCAGADLNWMKRMAGYSRDDNLADARELERLMRSLHEFPRPVIAVVQGAAFGGAVGLVSCCDIALASDAASFCLSEVKLGLAPAVISPYVVAAIGARQAGRYFLSAERFTATTAREIGLVHEVVPATALAQAADDMIATLLANGPVALMACKALLRKVAPAASAEVATWTTELIASLRTSQEGQEGLSAFFAKRTPAWQHKE